MEMGRGNAFLHLGLGRRNRLGRRGRLRWVRRGGWWGFEVGIGGGKGNGGVVGEGVGGGWC